MNHSANWNNPLTVTFISGVNVPLPQETFKVGFKAKSASTGFIQKQETMFGNLSFSRAGLTKALMLVYWKEMLNVRSGSILICFGSLYSRLVSAFRNFS